MAGDTNNQNKIFSENDALDINELASLNEDFSPEFIEQLQNQVSKTAGAFTKKNQDDSTLFEEVNQSSKEDSSKVSKDLNDNLDDNFIKKYKAKLNKQETNPKPQEQESTTNGKETPTNTTIKTEPTIPQSISPAQIESLTGGNIVERPIEQNQIKYNESLDYVDDNVKYSKYVIYIDPENTEFIESLTVKERKNLINKVLREQDDIAITKKRLNLIQTAIKHAIIAVITVAISIPITYNIINASLEASINNYRRSQKYFNTLYKEKGKIKKVQKKYN